MPFILGFVEEPQGFLKYGALFVDYFFIFDIFFNFFAATREEDGTLITRNKKIAINYMKGWFFFDLIASFPFEEVINLTVKYRTNSGPVDNQNLQLAKMMKLPRISRISRIARLFKVIKFLKKNPTLTKLKDELNISNGAVRLAKSAMMGLVIVHGVACLWFFSARLNDFSEDTWIVRLDELDSSMTRQYILSLYWSVQTVLTVGYGDIGAVTALEKWICISWMMFGVIIYAFGIGTISQVLEKVE